jgi:peptidoglycan/LPS O-acetylase OafA/YrhL
VSTVREIRSLTGLRGVAAIYVVVYHYTSLYTGMYHVGSYDAYANPLRTFISHGYLAVDLFFILSGFVMALNYQRMFVGSWSWGVFGKFLGRRIARIYPLYLAATLIGWYLTSHQRVVPPSTGKSLVLNLLMMQVWGIKCISFGASWSISAEFAAYLLFPLLLIPVAFRKPLASWITALVCVAGLLALYLASPYVARSLAHDQLGLLDYFDYHFGLCILRCICEFTLGLIAFRLEATPFGRRLGSSMWASIVLSLLILGLLPIARMDLVIVLLCPFLIASLASGDSLPKRLLSVPLLEKLGVYSYGIYLVHPLMMTAIRRINVVAQGKGLSQANFYGFAAASVLTLLFAMLGNKFIEIPGRQWLRSVFEGGKVGRQPKSVV